MPPECLGNGIVAGIGLETGEWQLQEASGTEEMLVGRQPVATDGAACWCQHIDEA